MKKNNFWYVLILTASGPKFVSKIDNKNKTFEADGLTPPVEMSKEFARDLVNGLTANGITAYAVDHIQPITVQPYRYEKGNFKWEGKNNENK